MPGLMPGDAGRGIGSLWRPRVLMPVTTVHLSILQLHQSVVLIQGAAAETACPTDFFPIAVAGTWDHPQHRLRKPMAGAVCAGSTALLTGRAPVPPRSHG